MKRTIRVFRFTANVFLCSNDQRLSLSLQKLETRDLSAKLRFCLFGSGSIYCCMVKETILFSVTRLEKARYICVSYFAMYGVLDNEYY